MKSQDTLTIPYENLSQSDLEFYTDASNFKIAYTNDLNEKMVIVVDRKNKLLTLNRASSGKVAFHESFANPNQKMVMTNLPYGKINFRIVTD